MIVHLILDGEGSMGRFADKAIVQAGHEVTITSLRDGTAAGKPSVAFWAELPSGEIVVLEMTLAMLQTAMAGLRGRYGDIE